LRNDVRFDDANVNITDDADAPVKEDESDARAWLLELQRTNLKVLYQQTPEHHRLSIKSQPRPAAVDVVVRALLDAVPNLQVAFDESNIFSAMPDGERLYWNDRVILQWKPPTFVWSHVVNTVVPSP